MEKKFAEIDENLLAVHKKLGGIVESIAKLNKK